MSIFLLPTTERNAIPSAAESKALSLAHRQVSEERFDEGRKTLFAVFSPAAAEQHFEAIRQRFAPAPQAPAISTPSPHMQSSPLVSLVKVGLVAAIAYMAFTALTSR